RQLVPFGERAWFSAVQLRLFIIVDVMTRRSSAGFAVVARCVVTFPEEVRFRAEMAEMPVAALGFLQHFRAHLDAIVAVEGVTLDIGRNHLFAAEYLLERPLHRRRTGARRTRDRYDGMSP